MKTEPQNDVKEIWGSAAYQRRHQIKNATDRIDKSLVDAADMLGLSYFTTGAQDIEVHKAKFSKGIVRGRVTFTTRWIGGVKITNTLGLSCKPEEDAEVSTSSLSYTLLGIPYRRYEHTCYQSNHMLKTAAKFLAERYIK